MDIFLGGFAAPKNALTDLATAIQQLSFGVMMTLYTMSAALNAESPKDYSNPV